MVVIGLTRHAPGTHMFRRTGGLWLTPKKQLPQLYRWCVFVGRPVQPTRALVSDVPGHRGRLKVFERLDL